MTHAGERPVVASEGNAGDVIACHLADLGVDTVFGVASIHNLPILDAIARQGRIRFVPARGEAGAFNMADGYARVSGKLGVAITNTGTGAGNAAGAQIEAVSAGSAVLHVTTSVERAYIDRDRSAIHDAPGQGDMLKAISKRYYRVWDARGALGTLSDAASCCLTPPFGPVTIDVPVDVQKQVVEGQREMPACSPVRLAPAAASVDKVVELIVRAKRPMLWLGGGARGASDSATELVHRGFCAVTSIAGRGIVPEGHDGSLGAFQNAPEALEIFSSCDLIIVAGSRLRGIETFNNQTPLPHPLIQIDVDASQAGRNYPVDLFVRSDSALALAALVEKLPQALDVDCYFRHEVAAARARAEGRLNWQLGPYKIVAEAMLQRVGPGMHPFVRDVTIANATFGSRFVTIGAPNLNVHSAGGGIGQGISMAIGACFAAHAKTVALLGDGGAMLSIGELMTAVQERCEIVFVLMNDGGYGIIRNIQDRQYAGRQNFASLATPHFGKLCESFGLAYSRVADVCDFSQAFDVALATAGPVLIEVDMAAAGTYAEPFAGSMPLPAKP